MQEVIVTSPEKIRAIIIDALQEYEKNKIEKTSATKLFSINQVRKMLGLAHSTVKSLVENGIIQATPEGRISEKSLNEYLENKDNESR